MPYKDPIKRREHSRLAMQKFREVHKDEQKYLENKKKWFKITWDRHKDKYNAQKREYYNKNREELLKNMKQYRENNREKLNEWKNEYNKSRRKTDAQFLAKCRLRCLIYNSIRLYGKGAIVEKSNKYGLNLNEIARYLNNTIPEDFNNIKYHIDHIIPVSSFDLTKKEEVKKAFDISNLQWLTAEENIRKSNRTDYY